MKRIDRILHKGHLPPSHSPRFIVRRDYVDVSYDDGTSHRVEADTVVRRLPGVDAVVVGIYRRGRNGVEVLLRHTLRPAAILRSSCRTPVPEDDVVTVLEAVAGKIEVEDEGAAGVLRRAAAETGEEAGIHMSDDMFKMSGMPAMASGGYSMEKLWFVLVDATGQEQKDPSTDGSAAEKGCWCEWFTLSCALTMCVDGRVQDMKTELVLRRMADSVRPKLPQFNVEGTITGRFSSKAPNLSARPRAQNFPLEPGAGRRLSEVLSCGGRRPVLADYRAIEQRVAAHMSGVDTEAESDLLRSADLLGDLFGDLHDAGMRCTSRVTHWTKVRTPDGDINNCSAAWGEDPGKCQMCTGTCPDQERLIGLGKWPDKED